MTFLPNVPPMEKAPDVAIGQGLWPLIKSLAQQIPNTVMDPTPVAMTKTETIGNLMKLMKDPAFSDLTKMGMEDMIRALENKLFGPKTYEPLQGIYKATPTGSKDSVAAVGAFENLIGSGKLAPKDEVSMIRDWLNRGNFKDLGEAHDQLIKHSPWNSLYDEYKVNKLVPFGAAENHPMGMLVSPTTKLPMEYLKPFFDTLERKAVPHEFSHLAHFGGDEKSVVGELFDSLNSKEYPRWKIKNWISEGELPGSTQNPLMKNLMNENRRNPNELLADWGALSVRDILGRK